MTDTTQTEQAMPDSSVTDALQHKAAKARAICLLASAVLLVVYAYKTLVMMDAELNVRTLIFAVQCLPFMLVLPGMWKSRWRSFTWLTFIILLYFMKSVLALFGETGLWLDWVVVTLVVLIYVSATLFVRWMRIRESKLPVA